MNNKHEPDGFQSVDWDNLTEKRDWSATAWTVGAIMVIALGFVGGLMFHTSLTGEPAVTEEMVPASVKANNASGIHTSNQYTGP